MNWINKIYNKIIINKITNKEMECIPVTCSYCFKEFKTIKGLLKHTLQYHEDEALHMILCCLRDMGVADTDNFPKYSPKENALTCEHSMFTKIIEETEETEETIHPETHPWLFEFDDIPPIYNKLINFFSNRTKTNYMLNRKEITMLQKATIEIFKKSFTIDNKEQIKQAYINLYNYIEEKYPFELNA